MKKKAHRKNKSKARQAQRHARIRQLLATALKTTGTIIAVPLMALLFTFVHDLITQWDHFNAREIRITGHGHLSTQQVLDLAGIHKGQNILSVNLGLSRQRLLSHGWIADAAVKRTLPDALDITIREHKPAAVIAVGPGFLMTQGGLVFKKKEAGESDRLPVISGVTYMDMVAGKEPETQVMKAVVELLGIESRSTPGLLGKRLKKIHADRETGLTLTVAGRFETVRLGYDRYAEKIRLLGKLKQFADRSGALATIETVDLHDPNRIILGPVMPEKRSVNNKEV